MEPPIKATLLDLVRALGAFYDSDADVVRAVVRLLDSGKVALTGSFAGFQIRLP